MEGSLAKSGVWGYFDIATNGVWNKEGCATTPTICKALEEAGLGVVGKVSLSQINIKFTQNNLFLSFLRICSVGDKIINSTPSVLIPPHLRHTSRCSTPSPPPGPTRQTLTLSSLLLSTC